MTKLFQKFCEYTKEVDNKDAYNYRASRLKTRIKCDYPQLVFHSAGKCTQSELVFYEGVSTGNNNNHIFLTHINNYTTVQPIFLCVTNTVKSVIINVFTDTISKQNVV